MKIGMLVVLISATLLAKPSAQIYRTADMEETDASGNVLQTFVYVQHLFSELRKKDRTTSFEFSDIFVPPPNCIDSQCMNSDVHTFTRVRKSSDGCGSTQYIASNRKEKMILLDHSTRNCDDFKPHQWELKIYASKMSVRYFRGNPRMAGDTKCERFTEGKICTMQYLPSVCTYQSISVEGSNPCFAMGELKKAICERGLDADNVNEEDVTCSVQSVPICPMPMCAAPPEGCHYESSAETNEFGCPKYPCGILMCPTGSP